jgi:transcriptional regulator with XRE-family HTH domain
MYSNLKLQIWKSGIHQNRLAKMLQMDETRLSRIVNGYREPSAELRQKIATLLQCDQTWLFERTEPSAMADRIPSVGPAVADTES